MYFIEIESIEPIINSPVYTKNNTLPKELHNTRVTLICSCNMNGNLDYLLNHTDKEYLIKTAEYLGFQDAREFVTDHSVHFSLLFK